MHARIESGQLIGAGVADIQLTHYWSRALFALPLPCCLSPAQSAWRLTIAHVQTLMSGECGLWAAWQLNNKKIFSSWLS